MKDRVILQLYVSGMSVRSLNAIENIKKFCDKYLKGIYELKVIDLYKNPSAASEHQIIFSPSLVKQLPLPRKTLIGNFSDIEKVMKGLGITVNN